MLDEKVIVDGSTTVAQIMDTWPQTIPLFLQHKTDCIGCPVAPFCTLEETAHHYELDLPQFLQELANIITMQGE